LERYTQTPAWVLFETGEQATVEQEARFNPEKLWIDLTK